MRLINILKVAFSILGFAALCFEAKSENLIILHTNDTHSTIDPLPDGTGGILQRKAIIDSIRGKEKNVILVDAGDAVQGTLYFKYFGGDVEYPLMDMAGYDIRILGNHEFDNGVEELAERYRDIKGTPLSANYNFSGTELDGIFQPYVIKEFDDKKIGFIGINIDPTSIIAQKNFGGKYIDLIPVANETASMLRNEMGCDLIVAVTHIGYEKVNEKTTDIELAQSSEDIDIIIGGHTHTLIDPAHPEEYPSLIPNKKGKPVRVVQTGKNGRFLGKITIDLDVVASGNGTGNDWIYELIPVTDRFDDSQLDKKMSKFIEGYREKVDSVNRVPVAWSAFDLPMERTGGLANLTADFGLQYAKILADSLRKANPDFPHIDMAIMNVGGIRHKMPEGIVSEGQILSTYPFSNKFIIMAIKGKNIIDAMRVAAIKGGEAVSENVRVVIDGNGDLLRVIIDGVEMDPEKEYVVGTIDYVAEGNDDMTSLAYHRKLWSGDEDLGHLILDWMRQQTALGLKIAPDLAPRFSQVFVLEE